MKEISNVVYEYFHDKNDKLQINKGESTVTKTHFHRNLEILYMFDGEMHCEVGDDVFEATADDIIFVHNYYHHAFTPVSRYEKLFLIVPFNYENDFDGILQHSSLPSHLCDKEFNRELLRPIFSRMYENEDKMSTLVKKGYLNVIMGTLLDHYPTVKLEKNRSISFLVKVLSYIDENSHKPLTLDSISKEFGYNKYYFSRLFNKYIGENINNYINLVRLRHFMERLHNGDKRPVSEMAFECGFDSLTTFYRYFNRVYEKNPKKYFEERN